MRRRGECGKIKPIVNEATFLQLCEHLSDNLWLQGLLVAVGTCFLEDAGRCGVGLLVAAGHMEAWLAGARFLQVLNWVQFGIREGFWQG